MPNGYDDNVNMTSGVYPSEIVYFNEVSGGKAEHQGAEVELPIHAITVNTRVDVV